MLRYLPILLLFAAMISPANMARAETFHVILALSDSSVPYQQFSAAFNQALAASKVDVTVVKSPVDKKTRADLIVAVGMKATESAITHPDVPLLGVMIPKVGYELLIARYPEKNKPGSISAIYLDQPWERQLDFIRAALPGHKKIGLLYPSDTHMDFTALRRNVSERNLSLSARPVRSAERLFPALDEILGDIDVLLAIPDSTIYNSSNVRNILLTSYRHKIPLIGISQAYVNAGAICAIFSTPEQLAGQAAEMAVLFARNRNLPPPQYPMQFDIALNQQVARSLGIALDTAEAIRERMGRAGEEKQ